MAKAELSWSKPNVVANPNHLRDVASRGHSRVPSGQTMAVEPRVNLAIADWTLDIRGMATPLSKTLVLVSALEQEATDYAIDTMCGEVTWGTCERSRRHGP